MVSSMSIEATHSMALTTPALLQGIDLHYETENRLVWKNASWFTRSAGFRSSTRGVAFRGHRGANKNCSQIAMSRTLGKLRVRLLPIESALQTSLQAKARRRPPRAGNGRRRKWSCELWDWLRESALG